MADKIVLPKFLTSELAEEVAWYVIQQIGDPNSMIWSLITDQERRDGYHFVINAPCRRNGYPSREVLFEISRGVPPHWPYPYAEIARNKNRQIVEGRSDGASIWPHLLFTGDTPYWGGYEFQGIIVTCSGFSERADREVSKVLAMELAARAKKLWEASDDKKNEVCFLT